MIFRLVAALIASGLVAQATELSWETTARIAAVSGSEFTRVSSSGKLDSLDWGLGAVASTPLREGVLVRAGVDLQRTEFGVPGGVNLPDTLQAATLIVGADFQLGQAWLLRLEIQPGFYGAESELRGRDFNVPLILGGSYFVSADLLWIAGLSVDVNRKYPVLPGLGVRWRIGPRWVLNAILPAPRIEFEYSKALTLYAGAEVRGGTYRAGDLDGRFRRAVVEYTQVRVGLGAHWKIAGAVSIEAEAGCVPSQSFDFHRVDWSSRSRDPAAYGGLALKAEF